MTSSLLIKALRITILLLCEVSEFHTSAQIKLCQSLVSLILQNAGIQEQEGRDFRVRARIAPGHDTEYLPFTDHVVTDVPTFLVVLS